MSFEDYGRIIKFDKNLNMKTIKLLVLLTTINFFGQTNFIKGTITTNEGTVVEGFIDYQEWRTNPKEIKFKSNDAIIIYSPMDISRFNVSNEIYFAKKVVLDVTPQRLSSLKKNIKPILKEKILFLNSLVLGEINLFLYENERQHFFLELNGKIEELIYRKKLTDDKMNISYNRRYVGQLKLFLNDCSLSDNLNNLEYKISQIENLIKKYNECKGGGSSFVKKKMKTHNEFFILVGLRNSNLTITNNGSSDNVQYNPSSNTSLSIGVAFNWFFSRNRQQLSLLNELSYNSYKYNSDSKVFNNSNQWFTDYSLNVDLSQVKLVTLIRYQFLFRNSDFDPFINVGIGNGFLISDGSFENKKVSFYGTETITSDEPFGGIRSHEESLVIGIGGRYKRFMGEVRYEKGRDIAEYVSYLVSNKNISLILSYIFN